MDKLGTTAAVILEVVGAFGEVEELAAAVGPGTAAQDPGYPDLAD